MRQRSYTLFIVLLLGVVSPAWAQDFRLKQATHEQVKEAIREREAPVKVVNFWATWCAPCRVEFPDFVRFGKKFADNGVDVIFVSIDSPNQETTVLRFLQKNDVEGVTYLKSGGTKEFISAFSEKWKGSLPATFLYGPNDEQQAFWRGRTPYDKLKKHVTDILASTQSQSP